MVKKVDEYAGLKSQFSELNLIQIRHLRDVAEKYVNHQSKSNYYELMTATARVSSRGDNDFYHGVVSGDNYETYKFAKDAIKHLDDAARKLGGKNIDSSNLDATTKTDVEDLKVYMGRLSPGEFQNTRVAINTLLMHTEGEGVTSRKTHRVADMELARSLPENIRDIVAPHYMRNEPKDGWDYTKRQDFLSAASDAARDETRTRIAEAVAKHEAKQEVASVSHSHTVQPQKAVVNAQGVAAAQALLDGKGSKDHEAFFQKHLGIANVNSDAERLTHFALESYVKNGGDMAAAKTEMLAHAMRNGVSKGESTALAMSPTQISNMVATAAGKGESAGKA